MNENVAEDDVAEDPTDVANDDPTDIAIAGLPELVSTGDIARLAEVTPAAVVNWKARYANLNAANNPNGIPRFPRAVVVTGGGPLYSKVEVEAWLNARRKAQA